MSRRKGRHVADVAELTPEQLAEQRVMHLRMNGRPRGQLYEKVGKQIMAEGEGWPRVLEDERLGTATVPMTLQGLLALITMWDSMLLDEEVLRLHQVVNLVLPMAVPAQNEERERRTAEKAYWDHIKEEHPEEWERSQGARV